MFFDGLVEICERISTGIDENDLLDELNEETK